MGKIPLDHSDDTTAALCVLIAVYIAMLFTTAMHASMPCHARPGHAMPYTHSSC